MWFRRKKEEKAVEKSQGLFSTDNFNVITRSPMVSIQQAVDRTYQIPVEKVVGVNRDGQTMDSASMSIKAQFAYGGIPYAQFGWYGSQGFIGYQACAMIAQNWLVSKCCSVPARDAIRVGYEITATDGKDIAPETLDEIKKLDDRYGLNEECERFVYFSRVFGIRIAMFKIDVPDPIEFYSNPFNPDGIPPGSYRGITQIDPYWMIPELDQVAAANPLAPDFYEPTWWSVNGMKIHKSHLIISRGPEVSDILKPSYFFGGLSIPQRIYERVYAAERTANEAPLLAMTKRLNVQKVDIGAAFSNQAEFERRVNYQQELRNNFGTLFVGQGEEVDQLDTSLADLDEVIMTQFQLVAAASNIPATKLLGTSPKGFNATGEYEEASYHEELESIQTHDLSPLIDRHHLIVQRSDMEKSKWFEAGTKFGELDAMTAKEQAEVNKIKADTAVSLAGMGAIDGYDERARIIADPDSGYNGIPETSETGAEEPPPEPEPKPSGNGA